MENLEPSGIGSVPDCMCEIRRAACCQLPTNESSQIELPVDTNGDLSKNSPKKTMAATAMRRSESEQQELTLPHNLPCAQIVPLLEICPTSLPFFRRFPLDCFTEIGTGLLKFHYY